jgi:hypothetical protein
MNRRLLSATVPGFLIGLIALSALLVAGCDFGSPIKGGGGTEGEGLSGNLVDAGGSPVVNAWVRAYPAGDSSVPLARAAAPLFAGATAATTATAVDSARTDAQGAFRLRHLSPGTYNLAASIRRDDTTLMWFLQGVIYDGGKASIGTDTLRASGSAGLQVWAGDELLIGATCFVPGSPFRTVSDGDGNCLFEELPQGNYVFLVTHPDFTITPSSNSEVHAGLHSICGAVDLSGDLTGGPDAPVD